MLLELAPLCTVSVALAETINVSSSLVIGEALQLAPKANASRRA